MSPTPATAPTAPLSPEGEASRQRLLHVAVRLFAERGFANTSVRQIAAAAQANVGAIAYYFGDKQGLYRAAFTEPMGQPQDDIVRFAGPELSLPQALRGLYAGFVEPLKQGELVRQCTRLHMREMVEPTGLWTEEIDTGIRPYQLALVGVLCRHLQLQAPDDDVHRLAFSIVSQGVFLCVGLDVVQAVRPELADTPDALDRWADRMVDHALAMVQAEAARRGRPPLALLPTAAMAPTAAAAAPGPSAQPSN